MERDGTVRHRRIFFVSSRGFVGSCTPCDLGWDSFYDKEHGGARHCLGPKIRSCKLIAQQGL